jgi:hypothetical protein
MTEQTSNTRVLEDAQDILLLSSVGNGNYVFAVRPSLAFQKQTYKESISNPEDVNVIGFNHYWKFNENVGIRGSSTLLALKYDKRTLRPKGLWLPGFTEARVLDKAGKLENGVYRDWGLVVFTEDTPNKEIAKALSTQTRESNLSLPLVNSFRGLDYNPNSEAPYGIDLRLVQNPQGLISGDDARKAIASLDFKGNSGALRLLRSNRYWYAYWYDLDYSNEYGRVDWVCGEATRADLAEAHRLLVERQYSGKIKQLQAEQEKAVAKFGDSLK